MGPLTNNPSEVLRDFYEHGKLSEFLGNSVKSQGKI